MANIIDSNDNLLPKNESLLGDDDIPAAGSFKSHAWVKTVDGIPGVVALSLAGCFVAIFLLFLIVQTFRKPKRVRQYFTSYFNVNKPSDKTSAARIEFVARIFAFLFLAAGFVFVTFYNVRKMVKENPQVTLESEDNFWSPSILICPSLTSTPLNLTLVYTQYSENLNKGFLDFIDNYDISTPVDPNSLFHYDYVYRPTTGDTCHLFQNTSLTRPKKNIGAFYMFAFTQDNSSNVDVFIGDNRNGKTNWTLPFPQTEGMGDAGSQSIDSFGAIFYTETRFVELDESNVHRTFQCSALTYPSSTVENLAVIGVIAPKQVTIRVEGPELNLADAFSNIGGYISICGVFAFLFKKKDEDEEGFVPRFLADEEKTITADEELIGEK